MDLNLDARQLLEDDNLALLKAENDRLSDANEALVRKLKDANNQIKALKAELSGREETDNKKELKIIADLKARIKELEDERGKDLAGEVEKLKEAIREEVRKEFEKTIAEKDRVIDGLRVELAEAVSKRSALEAEKKEAAINTKNLTADKVCQTDQRYGRKSEQIRLRNGRDPNELEALANLSFDGRETDGMTQEQAALHNEFKNNPQKGYKMLELSAADSQELRTLIEAKMKRDEEKRKRRMERNASRQKERAKFGALDHESVNKRMNDIKKRLFPDIDPSHIHFEFYSEERPLPEGVTIVMDHGAPDYSYRYVVSRKPEVYMVHVVECVRVKERMSSYAEDNCESNGQDAPSAGGVCASENTGDEEVRPSRPVIEFSDTGFATVPCAELPVSPALYTTHFDAEALKFILLEKYRHCCTLDSIMERLGIGGITLPGSTFSDQYHRTLDVIRLGMEDFFLEKLRQEPYLNVDESVELVGVLEEVPQQEDGVAADTGDHSPMDVPYVEPDGPPQTDKIEAAEGAPTPEQTATVQTGQPASKPVLRRRYKHKYIWVFHSKTGKITYYRYAHGSRARYVLVDVLTNDYKGYITSDCFVVYDAVGHTIMPMTIRAACWVHMRRPCIEAMIVAPEEAAVLLDLIRDLFCIEANMNITNMSPEEKVRYRAEHSIPKLNDFFNKIDEYQADPVLMAYKKMSSVVKYAQDHKTELMNFIKNGNVDIHNNKAESSFKVIKKTMRVSLNIGSERAAMNHAFLHSLVETAKLMGINLEEYLPAVFKAFSRAPRLVLNPKKSEEEQLEKIIKWKKEVRPFIEPVLPWNYAKLS